MFVLLIPLLLIIPEVLAYFKRIKAIYQTSVLENTILRGYTVYMSDIAHILGVISITVLTTGLTLIPIIWPLSAKHTFSQHIARHRSSMIYYLILFSIFLPLFLFFFLGWFVPHFQLPVVVTVAILFVGVTQYACTFIPETVGWRRQWHRALAGASAFGLMPIVAALLLIPSPLLQTLALCSLIIMIILPIISLTPRFRIFGESYWIQVLYYVAFFAPVMVAAYVPV